MKISNSRPGIVYYFHVIFSHAIKCSIAIPVIYYWGPIIVKLQIANFYSCDLETSYPVVSYYIWLCTPLM